MTLDARRWKAIHRLTRDECMRGRWGSGSRLLYRHPPHRVRHLATPRRLGRRGDRRCKTAVAIAIAGYTAQAGQVAQGLTPEQASVCMYSTMEARLRCIVPLPHCTLRYLWLGSRDLTRILTKSHGGGGGRGEPTPPGGHPAGGEEGGGGLLPKEAAAEWRGPPHTEERARCPDREGREKKY